MQEMERRVSVLRKQVEAAERQLRNLKIQLQQAEQHAEAARHLEQARAGGLHEDWINETLAALRAGGHEIPPDLQPERPFSSAGSSALTRWPLAGEEYRRYGRQLIMPEIGPRGQGRLKNSKVLIVGAGGLGCPAAAYLAGAGVGRLGLVDGDTVEVSNLHRQIAHATSRVGMLKVDSAIEALWSLNPLPVYDRHSFHLSPETAIPLFEQYDLVLDCTDNPASRYLISDACVITGKPLVSASALKTEGQLMVLNNPPLLPSHTTGGPCYRCVFPKPPPAESVLSCREGGILGPVVGVMGVLQALEAIKLLTAKPQSLTNLSEEPVKPTLLIFSAYSNPQFRSVRLRSRREDCAACSANATITRQSFTSGSLDYVGFCGVTSPVSMLPPTSRISATEFAGLSTDRSNMLIDVRDETQYAMCALRGSLNVPWTGSADTWLQDALSAGVLDGGAQQRYLICKHGNDSQLAAKALLEHLLLPATIKDIKGGFRSWREEVDPDWPDY